MPRPEPDPNLHYFFTTYAEAIAAWSALQADEEIPEEIRMKIDAPRQTHGGWIFDKEIV
jgi:hypothetical protein